MYVVALAWIYVVLMMAVAEALSSQGTLLGALVTLVFYGVLPLSIVLYILNWPHRRRARASREAAASRDAGDGGGHAAARPVAPEREEG